MEPAVDGSVDCIVQSLGLATAEGEVGRGTLVGRADATAEFLGTRRLGLILRRAGEWER